MEKIENVPAYAGAFFMQKKDPRIREDDEGRWTRMAMEGNLLYHNLFRGKSLDMHQVDSLGYR